MDPLGDEGMKFATRMREAEVEVTVIEAPAMTHGFVRAAPYVAAARAVQRQANEVVKRSLHSR